MDFYGLFLTLLYPFRVLYKVKNRLKVHSGDLDFYPVI